MLEGLKDEFDRLYKPRLGGPHPSCKSFNGLLRCLQPGDRKWEL